MSAVVTRRMRVRNFSDVSLARVGGEESGVMTVMFVTLGLIFFAGLFAASDAASGRNS